MRGLQPSPEGLEGALRDAGIPCVVEAMGALAVIVPGPAGLDLADAELRRRALALLPAFGFTHLALELTGAASEPRHSVTGASLPRD